MKRLVVSLIIFLSLAVSIQAQSVTVDYRIVGYEIDFMKLQNSVQKDIDSGFTPLGLSDKDGKLYILYISDNVLRMKAWKISRYESFETMDAGIAEMIGNGWLPAGYTSMDANFFVLFLETDYKATYYKVKNSEIDSPKLYSEFSPFLKRGTIPMDLDIIGDVQLYLSVQMANMPAGDWKQVSFDFDSETLNQDIAKEMAGRYLPWGMDITDGVLRINFVKFK